jgi:hypothetical protein
MQYELNWRIGSAQLVVDYEVLFCSRQLQVHVHRTKADAPACYVF